MPNNELEQKDFSKISQEKREGFVLEFWYFLKHNKKWWLLPIILVLLILGLFVFISGAAGPFIYPLF